jgi:hypothetical protein
LCGSGVLKYAEKKLLVGKDDHPIVTPGKLIKLKKKLGRKVGDTIGAICIWIDETDTP